MRLLNCRTFQFQTYYRDPPAYAILSHTWQDDEVLFQDFNDNTAASKAGYAKIKACCNQSLKDGYKYTWIDTCCIDKANSVELQEAITSMFRWYKEASICYAYLFDLDRADLQQLEASRWFARGWTLQELIAPTNLIFYDQNWLPVGSKAQLKEQISVITRINAAVLEGEDLSESSIAQRMSWASQRQTTRPEDIAYCLVGIFGVSMPLSYGEGEERAFLRLQKVIMEEHYDHSIFAWKQKNGPSAHGILASSPSSFADSAFIVPFRQPGLRKSYGLTNLGLQICLPFYCTPQGGDHFTVLDCFDSRQTLRVGLNLAPVHDGRFVRRDVDLLPAIRDLFARKPIRHAVAPLYVLPTYGRPECPPNYLFKVKFKFTGLVWRRGSVPRHSWRSHNILANNTLNPDGFELDTISSSGKMEVGKCPTFKLSYGGVAAILFDVIPQHAVASKNSTSYLLCVFTVHLDGSVRGKMIDFTSDPCLSRQGRDGGSSRQGQLDWYLSKCSDMEHWKESSRLTVAADLSVRLSFAPPQEDSNFHGSVVLGYINSDRLTS